MVEEKLKAVILIDAIAGSEKEIYQYVCKSIGQKAKDIILTFGKPDLFALVEADSLKDLLSIVDTISNHPRVASTDTKIGVPEIQ